MLVNKENLRGKNETKQNTVSFVHTNPTLTTLAVIGLGFVFSLHDYRNMGLAIDL